MAILTKKEKWSKLTSEARGKVIHSLKVCLSVHDRGVISLPKKSLDRISSDIKYLSNLNASERFKRQDKVRESWKDYWDSFVS